MANHTLRKAGKGLYLGMVYPAAPGQEARYYLVERLGTGPRGTGLWHVTHKLGGRDGAPAGKGVTCVGLDGVRRYLSRLWWVPGQPELDI